MSIKGETMQALTNARSYDWGTWLIGIMRSLVGGGSGGVLNGMLTMGLDPQNFNFTTGVRKMLLMMGGAFLIGALVSMFIFLHTHSAPDANPPAQP